MDVQEKQAQKQKQDFRARVWAILLVDHRDIYLQAQEHEDEINTLIDMGNENLWDAESVADAITQGF